MSLIHEPVDLNRTIQSKQFVLESFFGTKSTQSSPGSELRIRRDPHYSASHRELHSSLGKTNEVQDVWSWVLFKFFSPFRIMRNWYPPLTELVRWPTARSATRSVRRQTAYFIMTEICISLLSGFLVPLESFESKHSKSSCTCWLKAALACKRCPVNTIDSEHYQHNRHRVQPALAEIHLVVKSILDCISSIKSSRIFSKFNCLSSSISVDGL